MNLVWGNRYAMTMYEKRPTRWRDLPRHRDDVFLPLLTPWDDGERKIAAVGEAWAALPPTWDAAAEDRIFTILFDIFRHKRHHATELPPVKPTVAEITSDPANLTFCFPTHDPDHPTYSYQEILDCTEAVPELEPLHRLAMVLHNQYPWDLAETRLEEVGPDRRRRLRGGVRAAKPRGPRVHPARAGGASGASAAGGARRGGAAGRAVRARRRPRAVQPHAAPRGAGGRQGRGRLHERGPDPQRGLQLVADDRGRDPGEDRDRGAPLHGSRASSTSRCRRPGRRSRAPGAGRRRSESVVFCSCTSTRLIPSVATWLSGQLGIFQTHGSFDVIAACAGFPYGLAEAVRLLQEVKRPVLVVCAEKFSDKIGSVRPSRMIFGDGASAFVVGPAAPDAPPDIEVVQIYASGPVSQVNSIIWPNPEFDNNITVYGPEVKALVERYLGQMMGELRALPAPDGDSGSLLDAIDIVVPHQANKTMVATHGGRGRPSARRPLLQRREGRQRLRREHPARDLRRRPGGRDRPADAGVHAGVRGRRGGRLHRHPGRPRRRRSRAGRAGRTR